MDKIRALPIAAIVIACASIALSINGSILPAIALSALSCVPLLLFLRKNRGAYAMDRQLLQLLDESLQKAKGAAMLGAIEAANKPSYQFHCPLRAAISKYKLSGDPFAFSPMLEGATPSFCRFIMLINSSLEHGHDLRKSLLQLKERLLLEDRQGRRARSQVRSGAIVTQMGTVLFFPMFAGISIKVLAFASQTLSSFAIPAIAPALMLYIVSSNLIGFEYIGSNVAQIAAKAAVASALGMAVFMVASSASGIFMLG